MVTLDAIQLLNVLQLVLGAEVAIRNTSGALPDSVSKRTRDGAKVIAELADSLELRVTRNTANNMLAKADTSEKLRQALLQLGNTLYMELEGRKFYGPLDRFIEYFEQEQLFGNEVFNNFPSVNDDIFEAGTCLSLERATACVMHCMRVLEGGLAALAKAVGVTGQNDWGSYLRKIEVELDARAKAAGARSPDEQFFAEAGANFDRLRRAFRNPTMHRDRTYSQERAEEILLATGSFMKHLAGRLSE